MSEKDLKILESHKWLEVYFVRDKDLTQIQGKNETHNIYKYGHYSRVEGFDFNKYNRFIEENGFPPPATSIGNVFPNPDSMKPGIEIMPSRKLFEYGGRFYYILFDSLNIDTNDASRYGMIIENRRRLRPKIDRFLKEELYAPLKEDRTAYEKNLVRLIEENLKKPQNLFDLHVLSEPKAKWVGFDEINLREALEKGIKISIDWFLANKILAIYAINAFNSS